VRGIAICPARRSHEKTAVPVVWDGGGVKA
jgi:hypothetical protein